MTAVADVQAARRLHVDRAAIHQWTAEIELARAAYDEDPLAATRELAQICGACKHGRHNACPDTAWDRWHRLVPCLCFVNEHEHVRRAA